MLKTRNYNAVAKNLVNLGMSQGVVFLFPLVTTPIIIRYLGLDQFGQLSAYLAMFALIMVLVNFGGLLFGPRIVALVQTDLERSKIATELSGLRVCIAFLSVPLAAALIALSSAELTPTMFLIGFLNMLLLSVSLTWFFQGVQNLTRQPYNVFLSRLIALVSLVLTTQLDLGIKMVYLSYAIGNAALLVLQITDYRRYGFRFSISWISHRSIMVKAHESKEYFFSSLGSSVLSVLPAVFVSMFSSTVSIALFSAAERLVRAGFLVIMVLGNSLFPESCKAFKEGRSEGRRWVSKLLWPYLLLSCFLLVFLIQFDTQLFRFFSIPEVPQPLFVILVVWLPLAALTNWAGVNYLTASGQTGIYNKFLSATAFVACSGYLLLGWIWSAEGVAAALLLAEFVLAILLIREFRVSGGKEVVVK